MEIIGIDNFNFLGDLIPIEYVGLAMGFIITFGGIVYAYWNTRED